MSPSNQPGVPDSFTQSATPEPVRLRPGTLFDVLEMVRISSSAYADTSLPRFLFPHRFQHPNCYIRGRQQQALARLLNPRNVSFLALIPGKWNGKFHEKDEAVGCIVFSRLGDDDGAKRQIASRESVWLWILSWVLWVLVKIWNVVLGGDKSASPSAHKMFVETGKEHYDLYWDPVKFPERQNRWHVLTVAVTPAHQGKGIGKILMREVIKRAEEEGVCIGLEASPSGEPLHRRVGFELLGRFSLVISEEERDKGGVMLWRPKGWVDGKGLVKTSTVEEG